MKRSFDYIIVGAGTAGCVLARRLLEQTDATVALVEAGAPADREDIARSDVLAVTALWGDPDVTWPYRTEAQAGLDGRSIDLPQGKVVGGSGSINAMIYVQGNPADFDHWESLGNTGWGYRDLAPYFRAAEQFDDDDAGGRGHDGPLHVRRYGRPSPVAEAFLGAAAGLGYPAAGGEYNGERRDHGAFLYQSTRDPANQRSSTSTGYLRPVLGNPRLTVFPRTTVHSIVLAGDRAIGVRHGPSGEHLAADEEVIVACGALSSPALLMRSGIGRPEHLSQHGITPVVALPGVGQNLQDHLLLGVGYASTVELPFPELIAEAGLFAAPAPAAGTEPGAPELQMLAGPVQFIRDEYKTDGPGFTFAPVLLHPQSRGEIRLRSADPAALPLVDPHYLEDPADLDVLVRGIELARELAGSPAFDRVRGRELAPGTGQELAGYVRQSATTVWHPVGTCAMGPAETGVVDPDLRVHGVTGLRVADASVMPTITSGNTNTPTIAIAERAAALITKHA
jgi:choline dehydrogenase